MGKRDGFEAVAFYNGLVVFDGADLHGGGLSWGQDVCRVLLELGVGRRHRLFEYCAGPGYIGYSLLAYGFCQELALADINPDAVNVARRTAKYNHIEERVHINQSDGLSGIPQSEKWDRVVSNTPHFLPCDESDTDLRSVDPDWSVHRKFYSAARNFMAPRGRVLMMENQNGSSVADFEPMIREGAEEWSRFGSAEV